MLKNGQMYLYSLKTPEILWFSWVFRGYKMGRLNRYRLMLVIGFLFSYQAVLIVA